MLLNTHKPRISVIIPSYNQDKTIRKCLESILHQKTKVPYEVIIVDSSDNGTQNIIREYVPKVSLIALRKRAFAGKARNIGLKKARGEIIAFTDTDCIVDENWIETISTGHKFHSAVTGSIQNGNPDKFFAWSMYISEFSHFIKPSQSILPCAATCNVAYDRQIFTRYGYFPEDIWPGEDTVFNCRIKEGIFFNNKMIIKHINRTKLGSIIKHSYRLGYYDKCVMDSQDKMGRIFGLCPLLAFFIIPYHFLLICYNSARAGYLGIFLLTSPFVFLNRIAWAFGVMRKLSVANNKF